MLKDMRTNQVKTNFLGLGKIILVLSLLFSMVLACTLEPDIAELYQEVLEANGFKVSFVDLDPVDGGVILTKYVPRNQLVSLPPHPTKTNKTFSWWYFEEDPDGNPGILTPWDFQQDKVTGDMILYADWNNDPPGNHAVVYFANDPNANFGGNRYKVEYAAHGAPLTLPAPPTRIDTGYVFDRWFMDTNCTNVWLLTADVTESMALYAKWNKTITILNIPGVPQPVTGAAPVSSIAETEEYTGTVTWASTGGPLSGNFEASTVYTATITLTAKDGFTLTGVGANHFIVVDATSVSNAANSGVITAVFPATGATAPVTYTYNNPGISGNTNGIIYAVGTLAPASPQEATTTITVPITASGSATLAGTFTITLTGTGVTTTSITNVVTASGSAAGGSLSFNMPASNVSNLAVAISFVAATPTSVILATGSVGTAGNGKITALTTGKYYMVIEDSSISYVQADGTLSANLEDIESLAGTEIIGLTNGHTYKVILGTDFSDNASLPLFCHDTGDMLFDVAAASGGTITLYEDSTLSMYGIDLQLNVDHKYEIWKIMSGYTYDSDFENWLVSRTSARSPDDDPNAFVKDDTGKDIGIYLYTDTSRSIIYMPASACEATYWIVDLDGETLTILTVEVNP